MVFPSPRWLPGLVLLLLACGGGGPEATPAPPVPAAPDPSIYLACEKGSLPLVLSAPHGGELVVPGIPVRTAGTTVLDTNSAALARAIQARLLALTGRKAWLVVALASRTNVDFNRPAGEAYESPAGAPLYEAYHAALRAAVDAARVGPGGMLVDLHGQSAVVTATFRGTRDGLTADLERLHAPGGFLSALRGRGFILVPDHRTGAEHPSFNGGHIVATYGRHQPSGITALQLEFGYDLRRDSTAVNGTADQVAAALVIHLQAAGAL